MTPCQCGRNCGRVVAPTPANQRGVRQRIHQQCRRETNAARTLRRWREQHPHATQRREDAVQCASFADLEPEQIDAICAARLAELRRDRTLQPDAWAGYATRFER